MKIKVILSSNFKESDNVFDKSIVVMLDVLRASTTVASALYNGAKQIIPTESSEHAMKIFADLDRSIRFIGGEKNMIKPAGFDAGNSPLEYTREKVEGKTVIFTTTNGTPIFTKARDSKLRLIASFVNFDAILNYLYDVLDKQIQEEGTENQNKQFEEICFLCAGNHGQFAYEDSMCAGGLIYNLTQKYTFELSDSADAVRNLYTFHQDNLFDFLLTREHCQKMLQNNLADDITTCFTYNLFPVVPFLEGINIKLK